MSREERARAWAWMTAAAVALIAGRFLAPLGVDWELLDEVASHDGLLGMFNLGGPPPTSILGGSAGLLVAVFLAVEVVARRRPGALAFAVYTLLAAFQGLAIAIWLEGLNGALPYGDAVLMPGWGFRIQTAVTFAAGAALLWWVADRLDRTERLHGAWFVWVLASGLELAEGGWSLGAAAGAGDVSPGVALASAVPALLWVAAAGLALSARAYPVPIGPLAIRSPWDGLGFVALGGLAPTLFGTVNLLLPERIGDPMSAVLLSNIGTLALFVVWVRAWQRAKPEGERSFGPVGLAGAVALAGLAPLLSGFASSGGFSPQPGPLEGTAAFSITLEAGDSFDDADAARMVTRLRSLGAEASVAAADARSITLRVDAASDVDGVLAALRPSRLALRWLAGDVRAEPPPGAAMDEEGAYDHPARVFRGECDAMRAWVANEAPEDGCVYAVEPHDVDADVDRGAEPYCAVLCLSSDVVVSNRDVVEARVTADPTTGQPLLAVTLTESAGERFFRATSAHLREPLAITIDGEVTSMPIVQSAIRDHIQVTMGTLEEYEAAQLRASVLAVAFSSDPLPAWTLARVDR